MLGHTFALLAALAGPALAEEHPAKRPGMWYSFPDAGDGFEHVSSEFYIDPSSTWIQGYYAATQWQFVGHDVQYFGLQPRTPGSSTTGHLTYSVFGPGSAIGDPARCSTGADRGAGVSCSLDIDFDAGRWYRIESDVVEHGPLGRRWNGTFIDDTGKRTYIASFWTDDTYGKLSSNGICHWLEWWPFNGDGLAPEERQCQPRFVTTYRFPEAQVDGRNVKASNPSPFGGHIDDKCAVLANDSNYNCVVNNDETVTATAGIHNELA